MSSVGQAGHIDAAPVEVLPDVNQRVSVWIGGHAPTPSRVEDVREADLMISNPNLPLVEGDDVSISWEGETSWYTLVSEVVEVNNAARPPVIRVSAMGRLSRRENRRDDMRAATSLPIELRAVVTRVLKAGQVLQTQTVELGSNAVRFATSSPLAPGDVLEARIDLGEGRIGVRLRVIRLDAVSGSWRQTCTAVYDDILASDRERILDFIERQGTSDPMTLHDFEG